MQGERSGINESIFNYAKARYKSAIYASASGENLPLRTDTAGRPVLSPSLFVPITATDFDIRPLSPASDSLFITGTDIDVRGLSGAQDSVEIRGKTYVTDSESGSIQILSSSTFLTKNLSSYKTNVYHVRNTGIGVAVTVSLEIAPADIDSYYVTDGSSFSLIAGGNLIFVPSMLMKFARIRITAALAVGNAAVNYFAQS